MSRFALLASLLTAAVLGGSTLAPDRAEAGWVSQSFRPNGQCQTGTWTVPHGVTEIDVQAVGAAGGVGTYFDLYDNYGDLVRHTDGGAGGLGSRVSTRLPVTPGQELYIGIANPMTSPNAAPGGRGSEGSGGNGGAASWISKVAPDTAGGACHMGGSPSDWLLVAAGGGGGGGAASRPHQAGGAGGVEGIGGGHGSSATAFSNSGNGGGYSPVSINGSGAVTGSGGGGGNGGHSFNCTSGDSGGAGALFGDTRRTQSAPPASSGGADGDFDPLTRYTDIGLGLIGVKDCSQPGPRSSAQPTWGGGGGGGGGGLFSGGGGGGGDNSGLGPGGGGAAGTSYAKNPSVYNVARTYYTPGIDIQSRTTPPAITSADTATFTVGAHKSVSITSTGVDTPYVRQLSTVASQTALRSAGLNVLTATFSDGAGAGSATLSGTPTTSGVFHTEFQACNGAACVTQPFTVTINEAPGFTSNQTALFAQGQPNSYTVRAKGFPVPTIATTGTVPAWASVQSNGDGTATITGTPPVGAAPNQYVIDLTASNGIGATATQTLTIPIATAITMSPASAHLVPSFPQTQVNADSILIDFQRGWNRQFTATATRPDGTTFDASSIARWTTSNAASVTVTGSGYATSPAIGASTLTAATYGARSATASVVVAVPASIKVLPASADFIPGQTQQFTAWGCYGTPCSANYVDITQQVNWSGINPSHHIRIDQNGLATAQVGGTESVKAELWANANPGNVRGFATANVTHGKVTSIELTPRSSNTTMPTYGLVNFAATSVYEDGYRTSTNPYIAWSSQDVVNTGVVRVGQSVGYTSQVGTERVGTATITATAMNQTGPPVTATRTIKVISVPTSLRVTGCTAPVVKGTACQLTATATMNDGQQVDVTNGVVWDSSAPSVLALSNTVPGSLRAAGSQEGAGSNVGATFHYTGVNGAATITSNRIFPSMSVRPPVSISVTPASGVPTLHPLDSQQFTAIANFADGTTMDVTGVSWLNWATTNPYISNIGSGGRLNVSNVGSPNGTVQVSASMDAQGIYPKVTSNSVPVTITNPLDRIRVL